MIGLDTNVLVRYLVKDDADQSRVATDLIRGLNNQEPGYICREVIAELVWLLERRYKMPRAKIAASLTGLITSSSIIVEDKDRVAHALAGYAQGGVGFFDRMIQAAVVDAGCDALATFDRALSKKVRPARLHRGKAPTSLSPVPARNASLAIQFTSRTS